MRWLLCLLVALLVGCASTIKTDYIRVTGQGATYELAKQSALATAVEFHIGSLVISERESNQYRLVKEELLVYSAGYVDDYKIIGQHKQGNDIVLTADVLVASNKIYQRILSQSSSTNQFNGNRHITQYQSYLYEKQQGDKILANLLNDYPKRAYNIQQFPYAIKIDNYRNAKISVPYTLSWNYNYIASFRATMELLQDANNSILKHAPGSVVIMVKDPKDYFIGKMTNHEFNDLKKIDMIADTIKVHREVRMMLILRNKYNQPIWQMCHTPNFISGRGKAFYGIGGGNTIILYGNEVEQGNVELQINPQSNLYRSLNDIFSIELQIVKQTDC